MKELKASIVVNFGVTPGSNSFLKAELYDALNPPSPFKVTDSVYILVFKSTDATYNNPLCSSGTISKQDTGTVAKEDTFSVVDSSAQNLSYIPNGDVVISWYGNQPTKTTIDSSGAYSFEGTYPMIGKVTYTTTGDVYKLTPPTLDPVTILDYAILVLINGATNV